MRLPDYRALVCITTCRRLRYLRRYLPHFARFCVDDPRFSLLVSLDGCEKDTRQFCEDWEVPLVYSDQREGVGISKNRVLERFPDFDYYFFVEDDVELADGSVFPAHVEMFRESRIHHFSLFTRGGARQPIGESIIAGRRVVRCLFGGADFNFFTREALNHVGGWHPRFAQYRRWGHTEHTYRVFRAGLTPAPFNVAEALDSACMWHAPPTVTRVEGMSFDEDQLPSVERELIGEALRHVPVQTISPHHVNEFGLGPLKRLAATLDDGERYPLLDRMERREARSDYHLWRFEDGTAPYRRAGALLAAALNWPANPALRHTVKMAIRR